MTWGKSPRFPHFILFSYLLLLPCPSLSAPSFSNGIYSAYFPSDRTSLFVRSHLQSKILHKSTQRQICTSVIMCTCLCNFVCYDIHLCFLNCKSKYLCQTVGGILCACWQITIGSALMCLLDTISNWQKIGLNFCLALLLLLLQEGSDCLWH